MGIVAPDGHFHVRLPAAQPHVTHENIFDDGLARTVGKKVEFERPACFARPELDAPATVLAGARAGLFAPETAFYERTGQHRAAEPDRLAALHDHVIGKDVVDGQRRRCANGAFHQRGGKEQKQKIFHIGKVKVLYRKYG